MDNFICGGYIFSSNFDSGNLHKVELIKWNEDILPINNTLINAEFNLWTKPDCAGTEYENLNRSWFFFCVQGGDPDKICKFNVVNLNKQAKLFSQGMHPVVRVGENGKWGRLKDSPTYNLNDGDFVLSFFHKPQENLDEKFYYAFTFPFTYTECQNQLDRFESLYRKSDEEIQYIVDKLNELQSEDNDSQLDVNANCENEQNASDNETKIVRKQIDFSHLSNLSNDELESEIYFHRELLIKSMEGRSIDLLTITSFNGIRLKKEFRFGDLFPDENVSRCNLFKDKKIIFISSRVHPGETPSSFVLNGFLKMILDKKNRYATILRKMYVFKIVPFLNPDGVYNGLYRSDTLGHNLNRVYLSPKIETQPSIYAVRKLIRYYHNENDIEGIPPNIPTVSNAVTENSSSGDSSDTNSGGTNNSESEGAATDANANKMQTVEVIIEDAVESTLAIQTIPSSITTTSSSSSTRSPSIETDLIELNMNSIESTTSSEKCTDNLNKIDKSEPAAKSITVFCDELVTEIKQTIIENPSLSLSKENLNDSNNISKRRIKVKKIGLKTSASSSSNHLSPGNSLWPPSASDTSSSSSACCSARSINERKKENQSVFKTKLNTGIKVGNVAGNKSRKALLNTKNKLDNISNRSVNVSPHRNKSILGISNNNINISSDFLPKIESAKCKTDIDGNKSNMFLYIDLHGHASKKGIFMYGNHLPNVAEAVECMLLPRLMSMNCHHFHFDACVFSERNMYHKGKRDGLSKEGSGRVAIYKAIGLIKSYTLESNYNTGKYVNTLPPRGKEQNARKISQTPPKYTPAIFEEVGRALGPSILDLTDSNPLSRLQNSEFRSLQGLRMSLRNEIDKNIPHGTGHPKVNSKNNGSANFELLREFNHYFVTGIRKNVRKSFREFSKDVSFVEGGKLKIKTELTGL